MTTAPVASACISSLSGSFSRSLSFKTKLLVGVAAAALIADDARADEMSDSKWGAHIDLGGRIGADRQSGEVEIFVPIWQDYDSLIFGNLRGKFGSDEDIEGNFGLGFRTQVNGDWILGANAFFDVLETEFDNTFYQGGVGFEALTEDWDFRVNGYFPDNGGDPIIGGPGTVVVTGTTIQIRGTVEKALYGFDGEVGYRLPLFGDNEDFEIRIFGGGFYFDADGVEQIAGPRGRIEARIYDLDFLSEGSRLTFGGEVTHDDVRGTEGFGTARIRIPFQVFGNGGSALTGLDRRMVDRVVRDHDVITNVGYGDPEDVFVEDLQNSTYTIRFAEYGGTGYGGYYSPDSLADILAASGPNDILVVDGSAGTYIETDGIQLQPGQAFLGAGGTVKLTGADTGAMAYFTPKPGGFKPTLRDSDGGAYIIRLDEDNLVNYLTLDGDGNTAYGILGRDNLPPTYIDNFFIRNNMIREFTQDGIFIVLGDPASRGRIEGNMIYDIGDNAIDITLSATNGGTSDFDLTVLDNTMNNIGDDAVFVYVEVFGGSTFYNTIAINDNYARDIVDDFVDINNFAVSSSSDSLVQDIEIDDNEARYLGGVGVSIFNFANNYADIDQQGTIDITNNTIYRFNGDPEEGGIQVFNVVRQGAELYQTLNITGNRVADYFYNQDYGSGILVVNDIEPAGGFGFSYVRQEINIEDNTTNGFDLAGIAVYTHAHGGYPNIDQSQTINIIGNTANYNDVVGIGVLNDLYDGAYANQSVNIKYNTANYNGGETWEDEVPSANIALINRVDDYGTVLVQLADISGNTANGASYNTYGGGNGILVVNLATYGGYIDQANTIDVNDNTVRYNESSGIRVFNIAFGYGDAGGGGDPAYNSVITQTLNIDGNEAYFNGQNSASANAFPIGGSGNYLEFDGDGIKVSNLAFNYGELDLANTINVTNNSVSFNSSDGIEIETIAYYTGIISATINVDDNFAYYNGDDGIEIDLEAFYGGFVDADVSASRNTLYENGDDGIVIDLETYGGPGNDRSTIIARLTIDDNTSVDNDGDGIYIEADIRYGSLSDAEGKITITGTVSGNVVEDSGSDGFELNADLYGYGEFDVTLTFDGNEFNDNSNDALEFNIRANYYVDAFVDATVSNNTMTGNGDEGIDIEIYLDDFSFVDFDFEIADNYIADNDSDGMNIDIDVENYAEIDGSGSLAITGNTITGNGVNVYDEGIDIEIDIYTDDDASIDAHEFDIVIADNTITNNYNDGIYIEIDLDGIAELNSDIEISGNYIAYNGGDGVAFYIRLNEESSYDVVLDLELDVEDNTIYGNGDEGVDIDVRMENYAELTIDATFARNVITYNYSDGIEIEFGGYDYIDAAPGPIADNTEISGTIDFVDNTVSGNGGDGIDIYVYLADDTYFDVDLQFDGNTVNYNGAGSAPGIYSAVNLDNGIEIGVRADDDDIDAAELQILFEDNTVNGNDVHGIVLYNYGSETDMTASFLGGGNVTNYNGGYFFPYGFFGYGVLIYNFAGDQTVNLNGAGNDFGPNAGGYTTYSYSGGGTQTVLGP